MLFISSSVFPDWGSGCGLKQLEINIRFSKITVQVQCLREKGAALKCSRFSLLFKFGNYSVLNLLLSRTTSMQMNCVHFNTKEWCEQFHSLTPNCNNICIVAMSMLTKHK